MMKVVNEVGLGELEGGEVGIYFGSSFDKICWWIWYGGWGK